MRKQSKIVAVLSAAALLAIGASMTSFAATGWAEENGTWVYYDKDGSKVTDEWKKSGSNWFYLNEDGDMSTDVLIEDEDNYYYVGADGAMVGNQWVAISNEDAGEDDEPENYWYYFQANGKAYKGSDKVSFKTINSKKYTFNDEGKMQFGWLDSEGQRQTEDDSWKTAMYYAGDENDGAQAIGWRELHVLDEEWNPDDEVNRDLFDDEQDRWFYFGSNGKKTEPAEDKDTIVKTINGKKYRFDKEGRMEAEWSVATPSQAKNTSASNSDADFYGWSYFNSPEDGARVTKGWFKVVPAADLNGDDYEDSKEGWYYADSKGNIYASVIKTINGKKYAFNEKGKMISGLKALEVNSSNVITDSWKIDDDDRDKSYENEDDFENFLRENPTAAMYYFGDSEDGAMKTGNQTISLDGESFAFNFSKSGGEKGQGKNGYIKADKKVYAGGKIYKASSDDKYIIVVVDEKGTNTTADDTSTKYTVSEYLKGVNKGEPANNGEADYILTQVTISGTAHVVNTSGTRIEKKTPAKTGDEFLIEVKKGEITRIYVDED